MSEFQSVNEGTSNKGKLQDQAVMRISTYQPNQTLKVYAELLSWDLKVSFRTALDSYVLPMMRKGYLIHVKGDVYTPAQANKVDNTCKNCSKSIPDNTTFCSKDCVNQYKQKNEKENSVDSEPESFMEYAKKHPNKAETMR
jgi:hypothetical protein